MKKLINAIFGKKEERYWVSPEDATSQSHLMLIMLINAYPKRIEVDRFRLPPSAIKNPWRTAMVLRKQLKDTDFSKLRTIEEPHINQFGHSSKISYYVINDSYTVRECIELHRKLVKENK